MSKLLVLIISILTMLSFPAFSENRNEAVSWLTDPSFGLVNKSDFEEVRSEKGELIYRAMNQEKNGVMASIIGEKSEIKEIAFVIGLSNENSLMSMLYLSFISGSAIPDWKEASEWTLSIITNLAETNGGEESITVNNRNLNIKIIPPNIIMYNLVYENKT